MLKRITGASVQKTDRRGARVDAGSPVRRLRDDDNSDWCGGRGDGEKGIQEVVGRGNERLGDGLDRCVERELRSDGTAEPGKGNLAWAVGLKCDGLLRVSCHCPNDGVTMV